MQVFHGSYTEIESVDLSKCQANKDFGRGFYVTKFRKQAEEWAEIIGKVNGTIGVVTDFSFDEETAADMFFSSNTFSKLSDTSTQLYENDWSEIYKYLLSELRIEYNAMA